MYSPISCEFYDQLEVAIQRKIPSTIIYSVDDVKLEIKGLVKTLTIENGKEFLILENKKKIQLDLVFSFNGKKYKEE